MNEEIILFYDNNFSLGERFYFFMDLLVSNKSNSRTEQICLFFIFYIQIISIFFDIRIKVFNPDENISDNILQYINHIFRFIGIISNHKTYYITIIYIIPIIMLFMTLYFIFVFFNTNKNSIYTNQHIILNLTIKYLIYIFYNIYIDVFTHLICFNSKYNDYIKDFSCSIQDNIILFLISFITTIYIIFIIIFILLFYSDSFYLSMNIYAETCTNYHIYLILNCFLLSLMNSIIKHITIELFLFTNLFISIGFFIYYIKKIIYYDIFTNHLCGIFHIVYIWTTLFCIIFKYVTISEKGLIWLITSILLSLSFLNFHKLLIQKIFYNEPYYNITNIDYLLYYIRRIIYMINSDSQDSEVKSVLTGIMQLHIIECQNKNCILKHKELLYLPKKNIWSDPKKHFILDDVFLSYFIIDINEYFISINLTSPELLINLSYYYLNVIGNIIQSIYYLHKVKQMKLKLQEKFFLKRLKIEISKKLIEKLKYPNEICEHLEELNPSYYYIYDFYKEKFYNSIFKDLELLKIFWKKFSYRENKLIINYNEIFKITEKIILCKIKIENLWKKLFSIYSGINEVFDFYIDYIEQINDDSFLKIHLENIKRKTENSTEHIHQNYYNMMFNKETGIVICNGENGKEGLIEKVNHSFEKIFKYTFDEMRGMNISLLMPKVFQKEHNKFMKEYIEIGKKHLLNEKGHHTFAKDKNNSILYIKINLKIFPILNKNVYFLAMIIPEKIDDLIFIDSNFIIQGMSKKLSDKFQISNKFFFMNYNIPFYMICKNFIHFYKTFMQDNIENKNNSNQEFEINSFEQELDNDFSSEDINKKDINIEINENIELEYEIKIPKFILDFEKISKVENLYDSNCDNEMNKKSTSLETINLNLTNIRSIQNEEKIPLISNSSLSPIKKKNTLHPISSQIRYDTNIINEFLENKNIDNNYSIKNNKLSNIQINNFELIFLNKLQVYQNLFLTNKFSNLEDIIDIDTEENSISYKFNFTFKKYNYHNDRICYIIRCVDNKNDNNSKFFSSESEGLTIGKKIISDKEKINNLNIIYKISNEEKKNLYNNINEFGSYFYNDIHFQKLLKVYKDYIKKFSRIHGKKKNNNSIINDENSSQTSSSSFNSDLSKINRIFEMKENVLRNTKRISNIYNLILIIILFVIISGIFSVIFFMIVKKIHSGLKLVTLLNSTIYIINLRITTTTSSILSLKTLYAFNTNNQYKNYTMNTFIEDKREYFNFLKEKSILWCNSIIEMLNNFEGNLTQTANKYNIDLWEKIPQIYPIFFPKNDTETYMRSLMNTIVISNSLLKLYYFNLDNYTIDNDEFLEYSYFIFNSIENNVNYVIPTALNKIDDILELFLKFNKEKIDNVYNSSIIFLLSVFILEIVYFFILYKINKYIAFGFIKIEKISQDNIETIIQKIINFTQQYKKRNEILKSMNDNFLDYHNEILSNQQTQTLSQNSNLQKIDNNFSLESKTYKKLSLFNYYYIPFPLIYILCIFLNIMLYLICQNAIKNNDSIIKMQTYLFGRFLSISCLTIKTKCILTKCKIYNNLDCEFFIQKDLTQTLYHSFKKFPTLSYFYNEYFLKDACAAFYDKEINEDKYKNCLNISMIKLINNTNSLIDYVKECQNNLIGEYENKLLINSSYSSFNIFSSETFKKMEGAFYNFVIPVVKNLEQVIIKAFNDFVQNEYNIAKGVISFFLISVIIFFFYIILFFIKDLEYSIKIAKNIFRITPSNIISVNQELENWLETINNEN